MNGQDMYGQSPMNNPAAHEDMFGDSGFQFESAGRRVKAVADVGIRAAESFLGRVFNVRELRRYFAVSTDYVLNKLKLVLLPYTHHGSWQRSTVEIKGENGEKCLSPPRADINAPDLYIPVMGFITYIIICAMVAGLAGGFRPEMLTAIASKALVFFALDVGVLLLGFYLLANSVPSWIDCIALCGYVFVGVALNELAQMIGGKWLLYPCLVFTCAGVSLFLMRTVRAILLSDPAPGLADAYGNAQGYTDPSYGMDPTMDPSMYEQSRRRYFLVFLAVMQLIVMYFLAFSPVIVSSQNPAPNMQGQPQVQHNRFSPSTQDLPRDNPMP